MTVVRSVCVYCGSSPGTLPAFRTAAEDLGRTLAAAGIRLVYGGGRVGLMGVLADSALAAGGHVQGIIPQDLLTREVGHEGLTALVVTEGMHPRKAEMVRQSDAFVVLPGGLGTLDEAFEVITWRQLALHDKPILLVNVEGYWDPLLALLNHVVAFGFARPGEGRLYTVVPAVADVLPTLATLPPTATPPRLDQL